MDVDVVTHTEIARPCAEVAAFACDPDNATTWYENIKSVEWQSPRPVQIGSRILFRAQFLGRGLSYLYEVTDSVPGQKLVMRTANGPFPMETTYAWADTPSGTTRMTLRNRGRPSGFFSLAAPIITAAMRRANRSDLARLKALLESRGESEG